MICCKQPWTKVLINTTTKDGYPTQSCEKAIEGVETLIQTFEVEMLRATVFHAKGKINEFRNEYKQAILSYQKEFELTPTEASINRRMGSCYLELKEYKKAEEFIQRNIKIEPFNPKSNYEIALSVM